MRQAKWVKQLTRENSLLDRSLRTIAYGRSVREIGKAKMYKCPVVGKGKITTWYYSPVDYKKQQKIILKEFNGKNISKMGAAITEYLGQGYIWAKSEKNKNVPKYKFLEYLNDFNLHHAHARGAIVYGYWGEPAITEKLKKILQKKIDPKKLDHTLSVLSSPKIISGKLKELYHPSQRTENEKNHLIQQLGLGPQERQLVEILTWFTLLYELGERVSSLLYDEFLLRLKKIVSTKEFSDLQWYDPTSLAAYFKGKKLSKREIAGRKRLYVLLLQKGKLKVLSGRIAAKYDKNNFESLENLPGKNISSVKGTIASLGRAVGKVKIVITQADQKKMQKGDILVSTMTTPRLMAAVSKASAIVTDEGGLTAHAAIVARELGIPCVIGTKIATKVLKDGDLVEVDANKGTVKKNKFLT